MADPTEFKVYTIPDQTQLPSGSVSDGSSPAVPNFSSSQNTSDLVDSSGQTKLTQGTFQSSNYVASTQGWQLTPSHAYFNVDLSIVGLANISQIYTAGASINANDALYLDGYQSDGGSPFDGGTQGTATADGSGNATVTNPITVGNNSNRILLIGLFANSSSASSATCSWNGVAATQIDKVQMPSSGGFMYTFYLVAPATGAHNLTFAGLGSTTNFRYHLGSYYNLKQSSQPDTHIANTGTTTVSVTLTPSLGGLLWGFTLDDDSTSALSATGLPNNQKTGTTSFQGLSGDNGNITVLRSQTVTATGSAGNRVGAFAVSLLPITTPVPSVKPANATQNITSDGFIGFAMAAATAGSSVTAVISGEMSGLSGLTLGLPYYLSNTPGLIATSAGSVTRKVGIATSSTTLLITNIW